MNKPTSGPCAQCQPTGDGEAIPYPEYKEVLPVWKWAIPGSRARITIRHTERICEPCALELAARDSDLLLKFQQRP